jgi:PKD repeat protein
VSNLTVPVQSLALNGAGIANTFTLVNTGTSVGSLAVNGGGSGTTQVQVQGTLPANVQAPHLAPLVSAGGGATVNEGSTFSRAGSFLDSDTGATYAATVDYGDGSGPQPLALTSHSFSMGHVYADNGSFTVTVTVSDGQGDTGSATLTVTVLNVPPTVGAVTAPQAPVAVNTAISAGASFTDPGIRDTHTPVWSWGDGSTSAGAVTESSGSGSVTGSHAYAVDGVYTVTLTVTDKDGGAGSTSFSYVVVYDPSAGFTTGGGWLNSPAGTYPANPSLTGKANFGFNAKYKSGATVPTGDTEFQFPAVNLNFHSTSYDWLVVNGAQAQFQGSGTINGTGNYGLFVTAVQNAPSSPDTVRIQIWDKNNGNAVVYDSQPNAATTAPPITALGGGAIQIHASPNGLQLTAVSAGPSPAGVLALTPAELAPVV